MHLDRFERLLHRYSAEDLTGEPGPIVGLTRDLHIAWLNSDWHRFAENNDGREVLERWPIGAPLLTAVSGPLRNFYEVGFRRCLSTRTVWEHAYECSSPDRFRLFFMRSYPLDGRGLLVVHSLRVEEPHTRPASLLDPAAYRDAHGIIHQCSHCRRTRWPRPPFRWDWVPALLAPGVGPVSHGLCRPCFGYYYPDVPA
jgi:hypothetical protein